MLRESACNPDDHNKLVREMSIDLPSEDTSPQNSNLNLQRLVPLNRNSSTVSYHMYLAVIVYLENRKTFSYKEMIKIILVSFIGYNGSNLYFRIQ